MTIREFDWILNPNTELSYQQNPSYLITSSGLPAGIWCMGHSSRVAQ